MPKKSIVAIIVILLVAAAAGGIFWQQKKSIKPTPTALADVDRHLSQENLKIYEDRIKKAESYLASLKPSNDQSYYNEQTNTFVYLGQQYYGLGKMQKSKEMYEQALGIEPNTLSALSGLNVTLTEAGDLKGARVILEKLLAASPRNPDAWLRYIDVRKGLGSNSQELEALYGDALKATERHADILTKYAEFEELEGKIAEAIALWEEAVKIYPQNTSLYKLEIERLKKIK